jgi:hypothetical protein
MRAARAELAAALELVPGLAVYAGPPEHMTSPAAVVAPGRPYLEAQTLGLAVYRLRVVVSVPRTAGAGGLDALDDYLGQAMAAIRGAPRFAVGGVSNVGLTVYVGGAEHLTAQVDVTTHLQPETEVTP